MRAALYIRVSTAEQDLSHQETQLRAELERRGWELAGVYGEKVSGVSSKRPELQRLKHDAALSRFKAIVVWSVDRLGRSMLEVLNVVDDFRRLGVALVSLKQPALDSSGATGKMVLAVLAGVAEIERELIRERTKAALATARTKGRIGGRPRALKPEVTDSHVAYLCGLNEGNKAMTARQLGVGLSTVKRALKRAKNTPSNPDEPPAEKTGT